MANLIHAVRTRAVHERPYLALALFAAQLVERPGLGTFAVDKYARIYVDPDKVGKGKDRWSVEQAAWVLVHEIQHWLLEHHARAEELIASGACSDCDAELVNVCEDAEINDDPDIARRAPDPILPKHLEQPDNQLWEVYYAALKRSARSNGSSGSGQCEHGRNGVGLPKGVRPSDCGSGAHGQIRPWEEPAPGAGTEPGIGEAEAVLLRKAVAREIREAAKERGAVPAHLERWAERILTPPQVPWERELYALAQQALVSARGCVDYSYERPSRRGAFLGIIQAAMRRPIPEIVVVLDTSGSMSDADLGSALSEIEGVARACGQRHVRVVCCDAAAHQAQRVSRGRDVTVLGGGGTDMGVGIAAAEALRPRPGVIVVLTDGETPWPRLAPRAQLVVGLVLRAGARAPVFSRVPDYAKRVLTIRVAA